MQVINKDLSSNPPAVGQMRIWKEVLAKNIISLGQIDEIKKSFNEFALIRGLAMLVMGFYRLGERDMEDIDIVVENNNKDRFFNILRNLKYTLAPSGEYCFRRNSWELPLDVHITERYEFKEVCFSGNLYKVYSEKELFFEFLRHTYYQHYQMRENWKKDFLNLKEKVEIDLKELKERRLLNAYNFVSRNLNKKIPSSDYGGHFVQLMEEKSFCKKLKYFVNKIFPDVNFMKRRYGLNSSLEVVLFYFLRPFLITRDFFRFLRQIVLSPR